MATTTMHRILTRLHRDEWVSLLPHREQADLVVAAADVGDGRAAEELVALAAEWRRCATDAVDHSRPMARLYAQVAVDAEIRAAALRGVPRIRTLVTQRPELGVAPEMVAAEQLVVDQEIALRVDLPSTTATIHALRAWCALLGDPRVHLLVTDNGDAAAEHHLTVTGILNDCGITVAGSLDIDEHPMVAEFVADRLADRPSDVQPIAPLNEEHVHRLADALTTTLAATPTPTSTTTSPPLARTHLASRA